MISAVPISLEKSPKLGCSSFFKIYNAVDFPVPFSPTKPSTTPGFGVGRRWSLNEFWPYLKLTWLSKADGRFSIQIALNGHFFTQILQPMHNYSDISARFDAFVTTIHFLSSLFTGQLALQRRPHFYGLQRSGNTTAIRVIPSLFYFPFYDIV